MKRLLLYASVCTLTVFALPRVSADDDEAPTAKKALQEFNEFIGSWKGSGDKEKAPSNSKSFWNETVSWGWRFKKDDVYLKLGIKKGKLFKGGELRYLTDKKKYQFTAIDLKDNKLVFEGELKKGKLIVERTDKDKNESQQLTMNVAGDGVRFNYWYKTKPASKKLYNTGYLIACNKEGENLGGKKEGKECPVSGGLGTIAVTYKGETFYVCCTGCRDAFNENPEKYVKEFKAKKK